MINDVPTIALKEHKFVRFPHQNITFKFTREKGEDWKVSVTDEQLNEIVQRIAVTIDDGK
jgi:hypothetical protein